MVSKMGHGRALERVVVVAALPSPSARYVAISWICAIMINKTYAARNMHPLPILSNHLDKYDNMTIIHM